MTDASSVSLLAGILVHRMGAEPALHDLLALGVPHAVSLWGRRVVDESSAHYVGPYIGAVSSPEALAAVEDVDVLITVGVQFTDLMSGSSRSTCPRRPSRSDRARCASGTRSSGRSRWPTRSPWWGRCSRAAGSWATRPTWATCG